MSAERAALEKLERLQALLAGNRPLPPDLRLWLLHGLRAFGESGDLAGALGIRLSQGRRYNGVSLLERGAMERAVLRAADHIGPRTAATAALMARALTGESGHIPTIGLDFLYRARRVHGHVMPTSRNGIARILRGETRVAGWGLTR